MRSASSWQRCLRKHSSRMFSIRRAKIEAAGPASAARGEIETKEAASVGGLSCSTKVIPPISGSPERKLMRPGECR